MKLRGRRVYFDAFLRRHGFGRTGNARIALIREPLTAQCQRRTCDDGYDYLEHRTLAVRGLLLLLWTEIVYCPVLWRRLWKIRWGVIGFHVMRRQKCLNMFEG